MSSAALALREVRYQNKAFWRNPASAFFTFAFPLMFLVIFNLLFGNEKRVIDGQTTTTATFYVPAIAAFSVITACYTNIAIGLSFTRDGGILKRVRGTPLPAWAFMAGRIVHATLMAVLLVVIVCLFGVLFYDVSIPTNTMPAFLVTLIVGAASFCALGLAITCIIPNGDASPAIVNASILPLLFISDIFIPLQGAPAWLTTFAKIFPVWHFSAAMQAAFNPFETGSGFHLTDLAIVAAWGLAGMFIAARFFSWEPRR
jgi:ABC-2 type transport system permease protein